MGWGVGGECLCMIASAHVLMTSSLRCFVESNCGVLSQGWKDVYFMHRRSHPISVADCGPG